jgi:hypothetical protein
MLDALSFPPKSKLALGSPLATPELRHAGCLAIDDDGVKSNPGTASNEISGSNFRLSSPLPVTPASPTIYLLQDMYQLPFKLR